MSQKQAKKTAPGAGAGGEKLVARNPKATQRYEIEERVEAGLVLSGSEVKSLRAGRADLEGSFARIEGSEMFLHNVYIPPYEAANAFGHEPRRMRKLLLKSSEIERWQGRVTMRGYAIVPMRIYFKKSWVKVELGLGKGKKLGDDREKIRRDVDLKEARAAIRSGARARK
jgi:SsrA-binding protein